MHIKVLENEDLNDRIKHLCTYNYKIKIPEAVLWGSRDPDDEEKKQFFSKKGQKYEPERFTFGNAYTNVTLRLMTSFVGKITGDTLNPAFEDFFMHLKERGFDKSIFDDLFGGKDSSKFAAANNPADIVSHLQQVARLLDDDSRTMRDFGYKKPLSLCIFYPDMRQAFAINAEGKHRDHTNLYFIAKQVDGKLCYLPLTASESAKIRGRISQHLPKLPKGVKKQNPEKEQDKIDNYFKEICKEAEDKIDQYLCRDRAANPNPPPPAPPSVPRIKNI